MKVGTGPGVHVVSAMSADQQDLLQTRAAFAEKYCADNGWPSDMGQLSIEQILEIRKQPGWQNPE